MSAPQVPVPAQEVAIAAYADETHVEENRRLYSAEIRSRRPDHRRPLWLQASGRRLFPVARYFRLWRQRRGGAESCGARRACACCPAAMPRARRPTDPIPARNYIRIAMVQTIARSRPRRCIALSPCSGEGVMASIDHRNIDQVDFLSDDFRGVIRRRFARNFRARSARARGDLLARARHLVGAGSELQSRHQCPDPQSSRLRPARLRPIS